MEWYKVKNLTILFLLLLNTVLFALILNNNRAYQLSSAQERAVMTVLQQNNIVCYSEILRNFSPMRQIEMQAPEFDADFLSGVFLMDKSSVKLSTERTRTIYRSDTETLTIDGAEVIYRNKNGGVSLPDAATAERLCKDFLSKLKKLNINFVFDSPSGQPRETEDGLLFEYCESFKRSIISSNYIGVTINENGISRIEFTYYKPVSFIGLPRDICSADEALLTAMQGCKDIFGENMEPMFITKMDIVYHNNMSTKAEPYYRIYFSNLEQPMLINAYLNTLL